MDNEKTLALKQQLEERIPQGSVSDYAFMVSVFAIMFVVISLGNEEYFLPTVVLGVIALSIKLFIIDFSEKEVKERTIIEAEIHEEKLPQVP